jgi:PleD family two-component response regulator
MALARIKEKQPSLAIFDLNSARLDPLRVIAQLKSDPETRGIKTLGFVSHVHADTIAAAREAGIDEVLARSAFADRLWRDPLIVRTTRRARRRRAESRSPSE